MTNRTGRRATVVAAAASVLAAALIPAIGAPAHADTTLPTGSTAPAGYQNVVFDDEFSTDALDTSVWSYRQIGRTLDSNVSVSGGALHLDQTRSNTGATDVSGYRGAGIATKTRYGYGYYEARMKMPPSSGAFHPAFWTQIWDGAYAKPSIPDTTFTEIDIMESASSGSATGGYLTWKLANPNDQNLVTSGRVSEGGYDTAYHTYGVLYTPTAMTFYKDGVAKGALTYTTPPPNSPMSIWLSTIPIGTAGLDPSQPAGYSYGTIDVDWVRYYTPDGTVPATTPSSFPQTLSSYSDDFSSGSSSNWTTSGGSWSVASGATGNAFTNSSASGETFALYNPGPNYYPSWKNTTLKADLTLNAKGSGAGIVARYTDTNNYFYLRLNPSANTIDLLRKAGGTVTTEASYPTTLTVGATYPITLVVNDDHLVAQLNGSTIIDVVDTALANGRFGLKGYLQPFSFTNFSMTSP
jgi:beta-glucanase (GH16 family)